MEDEAKTEQAMRESAVAIRDRYRMSLKADSETDRSDKDAIEWK